MKCVSALTEQQPVLTYLANMVRAYCLEVYFTVFEGIVSLIINTTHMNHWNNM